MFFKSKKNAKKAVEARQNIENLTNEVTKIWNSTANPADPIESDVNGSYTGNPSGFEIPEQDPDDL